MKNPTPEKIREDRTRLIAEDQFAAFINDFLCDTTRVTDEVRNLTMAGYQHFYSIALRGHWLKRCVWLRKDGDTTHIYKSELACKADRGA